MKITYYDYITSTMEETTVTVERCGSLLAVDHENWGNLIFKEDDGESEDNLLGTIQWVLEEKSARFMDSVYARQAEHEALVDDYRGYEGNCEVCGTYVGSGYHVYLQRPHYCEYCKNNPDA